MGKSRRSRGAQKQRSDPISTTKPKPKPVKPPSDPELAALRERSVLPVVRDLQSSDPKTRTAAAGAVANIVQDPRCRKLLLREQIVHVLLGETLTDASLESRAAGWDILRLLIAEEGPDFCVHLYRIDLVTALQHAARKVNVSLVSADPPFSKNPKAEQNFVWSIAEALTAIIDAMAEAHEEAFEAIGRNKDIVHFLFVLISLGYATPTVAENALLCLLTLSEDNRQFVETIIADPLLHTYDRLMSMQKGLTSQKGDGYKIVLVCGILHNIFAAMEWNDQKPGKDGASDAILVPTLCRALMHAQAYGCMASGHRMSGSTDIVQQALEILASIGTTLQESLEKGSKDEAWEGIADKDDDDDVMDADADSDDDGDELLSENEESGVDKDDEEMDEDELEADMEMVTGADDHPDEENSNIDDLPTLRELLQRAVPQALKIIQIVDGHDHEGSIAIRTHAFATLNNISWTVSCIDFSEGRSATILRAWRPIARTIWTEAVAPILASDTSDVGLATMVTGLAWALARTLHSDDDDKTAGGSFLTGDEHKKFISLYHVSKLLDKAPKEEEEGQQQQQQQGGNADKDKDSDPFQSLGVKCIGVLGQLALEPPAPVELNRQIGVFLVAVVSSLPDETPAADAVEALNQLFDIYGDENKMCDGEVFWKDGFLAHLEAAVPKFRAAIKRVDKRREAELRHRADETLLNLTRFIQYKQRRQP